MPPRLREEIPFKRLCAIARELRMEDDIEWKHGIKDRCWQLGFRLPESRTVYKAIDAIRFLDRRHPQPRPAVSRPIPPPALNSAACPFPEIPRLRGPSDFVPLSSLLPPRPSSVCGCSKPVSGRSPLRCTREAGHAGDHGVHNVVGELLVRWAQAS